MSKIEWTPQQKEVIESRDKNILVSAGAGSGKTAVLTERLKRLVLDEKRDCSEMLVLTFTRAAAAEMKQRFVSGLYESLNDVNSTYNRDERSILTQIDAVTDAQISTIHSFAATMSRRYFEIAGVDPGFRVADQTELNLIREETLEEVFESKFTDYEEGRDTNGFIDLIDLYGGSRSNENLKEEIRKLLVFLESIPNPHQWVEKMTEQIEESDVESFFELPLFKALKEYLYREIDEAVEDYKYLNLLNEEISWSKNSKAPGHLKTETEVIMSLKNARTFREISNSVQALPSGLRIQIPKSTDSDIEVSFKKHRKNAKDIVKKLKDYTVLDYENEYACILEMNEHFKNLCSLTFEVEEKIREKKQAARLMSFNDLERALIRILNDEKTRGEIQKRYAYIFLDEFQDSTIRF